MPRGIPLAGHRKPGAGRKKMLKSQKSTLEARYFRVSNYEYTEIKKLLEYLREQQPAETTED